MSLFFTVTYAMDLVRPWEPYLKPDYDAYTRGSVIAYGNKGFTAQGFERQDFGCTDNHNVNVLQIWNRTQDSLKMLA